MDLLEALRRLPSNEDREGCLEDLATISRGMSYDFRCELSKEGLVKSAAESYEEELSECGPDMDRGDDTKYAAVISELIHYAHNADERIYIFDDGSAMNEFFQAGTATFTPHEEEQDEVVPEYEYDIKIYTYRQIMCEKILVFMLAEKDFYHNVSHLHESLKLPATISRDETLGAVSTLKKSGLLEGGRDGYILELTDKGRVEAGCLLARALPHLQTA